MPPGFHFRGASKQRASAPRLFHVVSHALHAVCYAVPPPLPTPHSAALAMASAARDLCRVRVYLMPCLSGAPPRTHTREGARRRVLGAHLAKAAGPARLLQGLPRHVHAAPPRAGPMSAPLREHPQRSASQFANHVRAALFVRARRALHSPIRRCWGPGLEQLSSVHSSSV